uniref:Uncharacterized protein n=1 Tax=Phenylobacterium glaciei TaxID=2803784 RepID=A0A974P6J7_9CAUL|nr:hypothetical protein JKL49_12780 [Phenylobacterium glaciei]
MLARSPVHPESLLNLGLILKGRGSTTPPCRSGAPRCSTILARPRPMWPPARCWPCSGGSPRRCGRSRRRWRSTLAMSTP